MKFENFHQRVFLIFTLAFIAISLFSLQLLKNEQNLNREILFKQLELTTYHFQNLNNKSLTTSQIHLELLQEVKNINSKSMFLFSEPTTLDFIIKDRSLNTPLNKRNELLIETQKHQNEVRILGYTDSSVTGFAFFDGASKRGFVIEVDLLKNDTTLIGQLLQLKLGILLLLLVFFAIVHYLWRLYLQTKNFYYKETLKNLNQQKYLSHVSHELRTPLNGILGFIHLILNTKIDETQRKYLTQAKNSSENLLGIVNEVLDYSKLDSGKLLINNQNFLLEDLFSEVYQLFFLGSQKKGIDFEIHLDSSVYSVVESDKARLRQILVNLIGNSIKFTNQGKVVVSVELVAEVLKINVSDTGIGIAADKISSIFEPYVQEKGNIESSFGGTGLGLSITKELIELMNGTLSIQSQQGVGTQIDFNIPTKTMREKQIQIQACGHYALICEGESITRQIESTFKNLGLELESNSSFEDLNESEYGAIWVHLSRNKQDSFGLKKLGKQIGVLKSRYNCDIHLISSAVLDERKQGFLLRSGVSSVEMLQFFTRDRLCNTIHKQTIDESNSTISKVDYALRGKVLLVEDDIVSQFLMKEYFSLLKIDYDLATDGDEALYLTQTIKYDCILLDFNLPNISGIDLTKKINRTGELNFESGIIGLTASMGSKHENKAIEAGMTFVLNKPITYEKLAESLSLFLENLDVPEQDLDRANFSDAEIFSLFRNDAQGLKEIVDNYLYEGNKGLGLIEKGIQTQDVALLEKCIHKLKGASTPFNFHDFVSTCEVMESDLENDRIHCLKENLQNLKKLWHTMDKDLQQQLKEEGSDLIKN